MKNFPFWICLVIWMLIGCTPSPSTPPVAPTSSQPRLTITPQASRRPVSPQIGLNFIRFYWPERGNELNTTTPHLQPDAIFADFRQLGAQTYRQFVKADLLWDVVEPKDNQWNFAQADVVLANPDFEPIVTLFRMQYTSPTPPWAKTPQEFQKVIGPEATDYLTTVVRRYAPHVRYWEIGNEMVYWRAADPGATKSVQGGEKLPDAYPLQGYTPQEQGIFLAQAAKIIRQNDPDAVILMPGLPSLDDYSTKTWLPGVLESGGKDWFDIVNYHYYGDWEPYTLLRPQFQTTLQQYGLSNRPVWMTETGVTSNPQLTLRTNYPNSPEQQAAEIFRRIVQGWGMGDSLVMWHTYIGSSDTQGDWSAYGIRSENGTAKPSYAAFRLLTGELLPFSKVERISSDARGLNVYKITTQAGAVRYVVWGKGNFTIPQGISQMTPVIPPAKGYVWQSVQSGQTLTLTRDPLLLK